jgi:hypothetical protein
MNQLLLEKWAALRERQASILNRITLNKHQNHRLEFGLISIRKSRELEKPDSDDCRVSHYMLWFFATATTTGCEWENVAIGNGTSSAQEKML